MCHAIPARGAGRGPRPAEIARQKVPIGPEVVSDVTTSPVTVDPLGSDVEDLFVTKSRSPQLGRRSASDGPMLAETAQGR